MNALSNLATPADAVRDEITIALAAHEERRAQLLEALPRVFVTDEDSTGRAADFISQLKVLRDAALARRVEIRAPHAEAVTVVDVATNKWLATVNAAITTVESKVRDYRAEQRELARVEQERQAAEERKARWERAGHAAPTLRPPPPAPAAAKLPTARGDMGSSVADTVKKKFEVVDVRAVPDLILNSPAVIAAIEKQCAVAIKLIAEIPGVKISNDFGTTHRRK